MNSDFVENIDSDFVEGSNDSVKNLTIILKRTRTIPTGI